MSRKMTRQKAFLGLPKFNFFFLGGGHGPRPTLGGSRLRRERIHSAKLSIWTPKLQILAKTLNIRNQYFLKYIIFKNFIDLRSQPISFQNVHTLTSCVE